MHVGGQNQSDNAAEKAVVLWTAVDIQAVELGALHAASDMAIFKFVTTAW